MMQQQAERTAAVIVAAGSSHRMSGRDKLWTPLAGRIALARTLDVFQASPLVESIVLVTSAEHLTDTTALCKQENWRKIAAIIPGGARRQDSVSTGLNTLATITPSCRWVIIHDAARPFVTETILDSGLLAAQEYQAAIAAVPVKDTIKQVRNGFIHDTLDRSQLWMVQTPQIFSFPLIYQAHHAPIAQQDVTDDAALLQQLGHHVAIFQGSYANIKITTQDDLLLAEALLAGEAQ